MTFTTVPMNVHENEPVTECFFFPGSKEVLMNIPGFPQPLIHPTTPAFRMTTIPGKGLGLVSTRDLRMGDLILTERPLLISARGMELVFPPNFTHEQRLQYTLNELERYLQIALGRMRPDAKAAYMALQNSHTEDGSGPAVGIMRTNGLCIDGLRPGMEEQVDMYSATCKEISRLNHSCAPNTVPHFDMPSFSYRLYAVRDITAGEELTFQYTGVAPGAAERNEALKPYDFVCSCLACTFAGPSDVRRAAISGFIPNVLIWAVNNALSDDWLLKKCASQLALIVIEGLQHLPAYFKATATIMEVYICLGDARNASEWAAKVHKQIWWEGNYKKADVELLLDPTNTAAYEAHPMWRIRGARARSNAMDRIFQQFAALGYNLMTL
ncbi:hypothetical protein B0H19DRAFT_917505 [Mycena capillaripes]|nr:hypothetical protein B0H19DRAFT_917505 [Mycena capillaripes]